MCMVMWGCTHRAAALNLPVIASSGMPRPEDVANLGLGMYSEEVETTQNQSGARGVGVVSPQEKGAVSKDSEGASVPFVVCKSLYPVPAKVVAKIKAGEFVDMAEILHDNIELERRQMYEVTRSTTRMTSLVGSYVSACLPV